MVDCQPSNGYPQHMSLWRTDKQYPSTIIISWSTAMCVTLVKVTLVYWLYSLDLIMTFQTYTSPVHRSLLLHNSIFFILSKSIKYFTRFKVLRSNLHLNIINYAYHVFYFFQPSFPKFADLCIIFFPSLPICMVFFPSSMAPGPSFKLVGKSL